MRSLRGLREGEVNINKIMNSPRQKVEMTEKEFIDAINAGNLPFTLVAVERAKKTEDRWVGNWLGVDYYLA